MQISASELHSLSQLLNKPIEYFYGQAMGDEEVQKMISLIRRMDPKEREILITYLSQSEVMINIVEDIKKLDPNLEEEQMSLLREFYKALLPYMATLNKMRDNTLKVKEQFEKALGITKDGTNKT